MARGFPPRPGALTLPFKLREPALHVLEWLADDDDRLSALPSLEVLHFVWYACP